MAWYIVGGILALICLVLFLPVCLTLRVNGTDDVRVRLWVLGFPVSLYPKKKKSKRLRPLTQEQIRKKEEKAEKQAAKKQARKKKDNKQEKKTATEKKKKLFEKISDGISLVRELTSALAYLLGKLYAAATVRVSLFSLTVASEDAAKTALLYGTAQAVSQAFFDLVSQADRVKIKEHAVGITADFSANRTEVGLKMSVSASPIRVIIKAISAFVYFLSRPKKYRHLKKLMPRQSVRHNQGKNAESTDVSGRRLIN